MKTPIFRISDGTTTVNLITKTGSGINTMEYTPGRMPFKDDGVWADSSLSDGRQLQIRRWGNAVDVLTLGISGLDQNLIIESARNLTMLLEKAISYFTSDWQNEPVWLERRGSDETNAAYSLIYSYKWDNDNNPFAPPFNIPGKPSALITDLAIEHGPWLANPPGESECIEIGNQISGSVTEESLYPLASADDAYISSDGKTINTNSTSLLLSDDGSN
jgi:hypothetical protein